MKDECERPPRACLWRSNKCIPDPSKTQIKAVTHWELSKSGKYEPTGMTARAYVKSGQRLRKRPGSKSKSKPKRKYTRKSSKPKRKYTRKPKSSGRKRRVGRPRKY